MISGILASASPQTSSSLLPRPKTSCFFDASSTSVHVAIPKSIRLYDVKGSHRKSRVHCNTGPGSGEGDSRSVLDAFFLGKALAEAINDRIESSVGEFLSTIGRLQAEQQKQVKEFQVDVLERARRAKEKAAREAAEVQGVVSKSTTEIITPVTSTNGVAPITSTTTTSTIIAPVDQPSMSEPTPSMSEPTPSTTKNESDSEEDTFSSVPIDD